MAMAAPIPDLVENVSSTAEFIQRINFLTRKIEAMEAQQGAGGKKREMMESKGFQEVGKFGGEPKEWKDWEFKMHNFVRPHKFFEHFLN